MTNIGVLTRRVLNDTILVKGGKSMKMPFSCILNIISILSFILTAIGLVMTYISLRKIEKVKVAQQNAQEQYRNYVGIDQIASNLYSLQSFFEEQLESDKLSSTEKANLNLLKHTKDITESITRINTIDSLIRRYDVPSTADSPLYIGYGYYNDKFFEEKILAAKRDLLICCKLNIRACKQEHALRLCELSNSGCTVRIIAISPEIPDELLSEILLSTPPLVNNSLDRVKQLQASNRDELMGIAKAENAKTLFYYETKHIPLTHVVVVDDLVYWGLVNYDKTEDRGYDDRPYLLFKRNNAFITRILKKIEKSIAQCEEYHI